VNEFIMASPSEALIGGIAGYYLQTLYITFEQAEEIEKAWRTIFRRKFGGSLDGPNSKPRAYFYQARGPGMQRRSHLWSVGLRALVTCVSNAMADIEDTAQRAAARSAVALAMEAWGCRSDPGETWSWAHCAEKLEASLRKATVRQLGEAWMLVVVLLEEEHDLQWDAKEGTAEVSKWTRDFGSERKARWGRWRQVAPEGDQLWRGATAWRPTNSHEKAHFTTPHEAKTKASTIFPSTRSDFFKSRCVKR
jgi:hypothetical protein